MTVHLKTIRLRPGVSMKRKARGQEIAAVAWYCPECHWQSGPCRTMAETRKKPAHECVPAPGLQLGLEAGGRAACR